MKHGRSFCLLAMVLAAAGCVSRGTDPSWGPRWPGAAELRGAAVKAARDPATWIPLAGAAVLAVGDLDEDLSDWAVRHQPLFGDDADADSDDWRSAAEAAWLVTALAAPSDSVQDKAGGLVVGASTLFLEDAVTNGIKSVSNRRRPDGSDDKSFTSGHTGTAGAATTLARRNLDYLDLPGWADRSLRIGLYGVAFGTGWARVEAEKHHVTDVLAGYAVGQFIATFMHEAFMGTSAEPVSVRFEGVDGGGAVTFVWRGR